MSRISASKFIFDPSTCPPNMAVIDKRPIIDIVYGHPSVRKHLPSYGPFY